MCTTEVSFFHPGQVATVLGGYCPGNSGHSLIKIVCLLYEHTLLKNSETCGSRTFVLFCKRSNAIVSLQCSAMLKEMLLPVPNYLHCAIKRSDLQYQKQ